MYGLPPGYTPPLVVNPQIQGAVGHSIEDCQALKSKVQELINAKWFTFKEDGPNIWSNPLLGHRDASINVIEDGIDQYATNENLKSTPSKPNAIIVQTPILFPYGNTKAVPWKYEVTFHLADHQPSDGCEPKGTDVTNISGIGGMTRSGQVYTPEQLRKNEVNGEKGKEDMYHSIKRQAITHIRALMKVLNEAHVTHNITVDQFYGVVDNITAIPTQADKEKATKGKRESWTPNSQKIPICDIRQTFQSAGIIYAHQVAVTEEDHVDDDTLKLVCVDKAEAEKIIQEVHEGSFGTHANGHTMARKILRAGYYWLTMESDCFSHVKKCHKCQIYADKIHVPPTSLNVLTSPWLFSMWGMDVIGLIEPKASNGHRFILVAIDYFTKWVEAASYANVTRSVVVKFIKRELICRYGLPNKIITDNATNLNNKMMKELCDNFKIQHHNSSPYRPKMNGAVEAANKNIKKIIQKMVETYKDWHEMLPFALHGYRTSVRTSTGATPFSLVYGMEAVLPIEVEIPSIKVLMETKLEEAEWVQSRYDQLNLIEEKRMIALCHGQLYQKRLKKAYEKKVRPREFREGELVLKKILPIKKDSRGKWTPNYEGPYVVKKAFSGGALILAEMDGDELPLPVNSDAVKKYYA
ncbi:uncharacterized protein [Cicer arietinum]|uniref:uncharacterized protein n=1 Tax=Cicer arietinum TaxID=3827 RepID=UPI003CC5CBC8